MAIYEEENEVQQALRRQRPQLTNWQRHEQAKAILRSAHTFVAQARRIDDLINSEVSGDYRGEERPAQPFTTEYLVKAALRRVVDGL